MCGEKYSCTGKTPFGCRITPACAGKSGLAALDHALAGDHPRVCGEKVSAIHRESASLGSPPHVRGKAVRSLFLCLFCRGSPPRMRGKGEGQGNSHQERRITPAYAGKSSHSMLAFCIRRGSPPHVRGKDSCTGKTPLRCRITPACAGKSFLKSFSQSRSGDHPRVCGEKLRKTAVSVRELGSPPRMRGKVKSSSGKSAGSGITPACAGKRQGR